MMLSVISFVVIAIFFLIIGIQLKRGKWLRLIAGNTFGEFSKKKAQKAGKFVSKICFALFGVFIVIAVSDIFDFNLFYLRIILIPIVLFSFFSIGFFIFHWTKNG